MWNLWKQFLDHIEYRRDEFLDDILPEGRTHILAAFAQATHNLDNLPCAGRPLVAGTVRSAVNHVALTFRDYNRPNPQLHSNNRTTRLLLQQ